MTKKTYSADITPKPKNESLIKYGKEVSNLDIKVLLATLPLPDNAIAKPVDPSEKYPFAK